MDVDFNPHATTNPVEEDDWLDDETPYERTPSSSSAAGQLPTPSVAHPGQPPQATQSDREWVTMNERYTNDGYREGITAGKLSTLQSGFDSGYLLSSVPARRLGALRGRATSLLALLLLPPPKSASATSTRARPSFLPQIDLPSADKETLIEHVRELVRDLGRIRMLDVVGRDHEADAHAKEHGEDDVGAGKQMEWQEGERKEMDELEQMMEGISGGSASEKKKQGQAPGEVRDLGEVEARLDELLRRVAGGLNTSPIAM